MNDRTEVEAAIDHLVSNIVKARANSRGRDEADVAQEIGRSVATLIADLADAKADAHEVRNVRDVGYIGDNIHDTINEAFQDVNTYVEASQSSYDPNAEHRFGHMEYFGRRHG